MSKVFTRSQAIAFIENAFGSGRLSNQGLNISVVCPMCKTYKSMDYNKQKLVIRTDDWRVHCWICGYKNRNILWLLRKHNPQLVSVYKERFLNAEDLSYILKSDASENDIICLPEGYQLLATAKDGDTLARSAKEYLKSRGLSEMRDLWFWKLGITDATSDGCKYRIIIPSYDKDGELNYWSARSWIKNSKKFIGKYKNPIAEKTHIIFNENNINWNEELVLVEGPFDMFKCSDNCTTVLGSELNANYKLFQEILFNRTPVLMAFDNEPAAQRKQFKIAEIISEFDIPVRILENPFIGKDVGDLSKSEFISLREHAKMFTGEYLLERKIAAIV